jgi:hypothetical protein
MISFLVRRVLYMVLTIWLISFIAFSVIQLPPGDYVSQEVRRMVGQGVNVTPEMEARLRHMYGLDQPAYVQYFKNLSGNSLELMKKAFLAIHGVTPNPLKARERPEKESYHKAQECQLFSCAAPIVAQSEEAPSQATKASRTRTAPRR